MAALLTRHWKLAILWAVSLMLVGSLSSLAQVRLLTEGPTIVSGSDVGFRIDRTQNGIPIGTLVIRVDGRWVEAGSSMRVTPAR